MSTRILEPPRIASAPAARRAQPAYSVAWSVGLIAADIAMFLVSSYFAALIALVWVHHWSTPFDEKRLIVAQGVYVFGWLLIFERLGLYRRSFALTVKDELYYTAAALALGTVPQLLLFTVIPAISTSRAMIALSLPISIVLVGSTRALAHRTRLMRAFRRRRRIAVVGRSDRAAAAYAALELTNAEESVIFAVDDIDGSDVRDIERMDWFRHACENGFDTIILTEMLPPSVMPQLLEAMARRQMQVAFAPPRIQRHCYALSMHTEGQQALIVPSRLRACTPRARLHKRIVDLTLACVAIAVFSPVMIACAIAIYMDSGLPVLFRQERVGLNGQVFNVLKFRSMRADAEAACGPVWARDCDDRRTRIGSWLRRLSFDELPQLFNVLHGDMSLVGPRPERPEFVREFRKGIARYDERHLVQPGITGWSQVHMRRLLQPSDAAEKLKYDLQYIEGWSPFLDASVLFQTLLEFLFHRAG